MIAEKNRHGETVKEIEVRLVQVRRARIEEMLRQLDAA